MLKPYVLSIWVYTIQGICKIHGVFCRGRANLLHCLRDQHLGLPLVNSIKFLNNNKKLGRIRKPRRVSVGDGIFGRRSAEKGGAAVGAALATNAEPDGGGIFPLYAGRRRVVSRRADVGSPGRVGGDRGVFAAGFRGVLQPERRGMIETAGAV